MRDSEEEYPLHQPRRNRGPYDDETEPELEEERQSRPPRRGQEPLHQREVPVTPTLPPGRLRKALTIGVTAGVLCILQHIIIVLVNASKYNAFYKIYDPNNPNNPLSFTIFGFSVLRSFISLLICLIAGFITGRVAVERRLGFLAGFVVGVIYFAATLLVEYIPGYPDHLPYKGPVSGGAITGGIIFSFVLLIVYGVIGGILGRLGAGLATRKHPYYLGYEE